jgi:predicted dehydrogenase
MRRTTRRSFLKGAAAAGAALSIPGCATFKPTDRIIGANDDIRLAVVGCRGMGGGHIKHFPTIPGVRLIAICDADQAINDERSAQVVERGHAAVDTYQDMRYVFDRDDIDGVVFATPNHWHALGTIWACQAGKDVYVQKPVCHNIWEGRKMIDAARKYHRIVQSGTQNRSVRELDVVFKSLRDGELGKIVCARGFCYKRRDSIGKVDGPQQPPATADYNLWIGPSPMVPLMRKSLHYDWHWIWNTGNGDLGNQGIHEMDLCRWALDEKQLPPRVMSVGGRLGYDDDGETANTQMIILDYEKAPIIFEVRGLPAEKDSKAMPHYKGIRIGVVIECENGYFAGGRSGGWLYDNDGKKIRQVKSEGGAGHAENFLGAMRSRKVSDLNADIVEGYLSSSICHMGNISHLVGETATPGEIREVLQGDTLGMDTYERFAEHVEKNKVDLTKTPVTLGPVLHMNPESERFRSGYGSSPANAMLTRDYREPFVVRDEV